MTGHWHPSVIIALAAAVIFTGWLEDASARLMHRIDEWWTEKREMRALVREDTLRQERARLLHPSSRGGGR